MIDLAEFVSDYVEIVKQEGGKMNGSLVAEIADAYIEASDPDAHFSAEQIQDLKSQIKYYLS